MASCSRDEWRVSRNEMSLEASSSIASRVLEGLEESKWWWWLGFIMG